jgi:hypothetical protein
MAINEEERRRLPVDRRVPLASVGMTIYRASRGGNGRVMQIVNEEDPNQRMHMQLNPLPASGTDINSKFVQL